MQINYHHDNLVVIDSQVENLIQALARLSLSLGEEGRVHPDDDLDTATEFFGLEGFETELDGEKAYSFRFISEEDRVRSDRFYVGLLRAFGERLPPGHSIGIAFVDSQDMDDATLYEYTVAGTIARFKGVFKPVWDSEPEKVFF